jgi:hypothetical protein
MLKNGMFVREEPPIIGRYYVTKQDVTPEERFVQNILLARKQDCQLTLPRWVSNWFQNKFKEEPQIDH